MDKERAEKLTKTIKEIISNKDFEKIYELDDYLSPQVAPLVECLVLRKLVGNEGSVELVFKS